MNRLFIAAAALLSASAASAQLSASPERFSPQAIGYLERARAMTDAGNSAGVIDQLRMLDPRMVALSPELAEEYTYLLAKGYYERGDAECIRLLISFREDFPASRLAPLAAAALGDYYFFHADWANALQAYQTVDTARLNRDQRPLYTYRTALAMIKTGHFNEARPLVNSLASNPAYADAATFYDAYLDYIKGDFKSALEGFNRVPENRPGLDAGYYIAQIDYSAGRWQETINRGERLLKSNPDPELAPEIQRIVGLSYFKLDNYDKALPLLRKYVTVLPDTPDPEAVYALGVIDYAEGNYPDAQRRFNALTDQQDAIGQSAWLYLGQCALRENNPTSAALAFERATRLDADRNVSETALYNYVTALTRGGKVPFSSSADMLETFTQKFPDSEYTPEVESYLATAYYNDHNYLKALAAINSIKHPTGEQLSVKQKVLYELGVEALTNSRADRASGYLQQAVDIQGDASLRAQAALWLGDALYARERWNEAAKAYRIAVVDRRMTQNRPLAFYGLAYSEYKAGKYAEAAKDFASALTASKLSETPLNRAMTDDATIRQADCLYYTGKYAEAMHLYDQAVEHGAAGADYALYRRAVMKGLSGKYDKKVDDLRLLERDYPESKWLSKGLQELALTYEEMGRQADAADAYKRRLAVTTDVDIDELLRIADSMRAAGRSADLLDVISRIRSAGGLGADEAADMDLYEADALADLDRFEEATPIYESLAANPSSPAGAKASVVLAEQMVKEQDYSGARDAMESFTEAGTPHEYWLARGYIVLADAYHGLGETSLAREYLSTLRDNYPGDEKDIADMISSRLKTWNK